MFYLPIAFLNQQAPHVLHINNRKIETNMNIKKLTISIILKRKKRRKYDCNGPRLFIRVSRSTQKQKMNFFILPLKEKVCGEMCSL